MKGQIKTENLTGQRFGRLTVIKRDEDRVDKRGRHTAMWVCKCECGTVKNGSRRSFKKRSYKVLWMLGSKRQRQKQIGRLNRETIWEAYCCQKNSKLCFAKRASKNSLGM